MNNESKCSYLLQYNRPSRIKITSKSLVGSTILGPLDYAKAAGMNIQSRIWAAAPA